MESAVFDVFHHLGATEEQLDFPVLYASAREGWASPELPPPGQRPPGASMAPLLAALAEHVPPPAGRVDAPFSFRVVMAEPHPFLGKIVTGRVHSGSVAVGDRVKVLSHKGARCLPGAAGRAGRVPLGWLAGWLAGWWVGGWVGLWVGLWVGGWAGGR